jgi:hypothetical protein
MGWPPQVGELLPRSEEAIGVRDKLATYSLNMDNSTGRAKARGFALILGITIDSIDYLEAEIRAGIQRVPIASVREGSCFGVRCAVDFPLRGVGSLRSRRVRLRTAWVITGANACPRMTSAYLKP